MPNIGNLKINESDYVRLESIILETMDAFSIMKYSEYPASSEIRYIWDIFHIATDAKRDRNDSQKLRDYLFLRRLYDYLNDDNVESALRKVLKEYL